MGVPDPRATPGGGIDPWRASEEDLKRQARGQQMQDDMAAIRRARSGRIRGSWHGRGLWLDGRAARASGEAELWQSHT